MLKYSEPFLTKNSVVYILAIVCCVLWGSAYPFIKIGYGLLAIEPKDTASQILFAGLRFALAGVLTILIFSIINKRFLIPCKKSWGNIGILGLVQTIAQYLFFYIGLANATASKSSIIGGISPFIAILIACFCFRQEKFTKAKLFGSVLGFAGIILINLDFAGLKTSMTLSGEGFILISSIASALSLPLTKIYSKLENPVVLCGYQFIFGGAIMIAFGFFMGGTLHLLNAYGILNLLYLAFLSAAAYSLWSILLKYNSISKVAVFGFMVPVFGVLLSAFFLDESSQAFNFQSLTSLLLVCAGIIIINKFKLHSTAKK